MISKTFRDLDTAWLPGQLAESQWRRVCRSLRLYIDLETENLKSGNFGDREWQELEEYKSILNDIEMFILPLR